MRPLRRTSRRRQRRGAVKRSRYSGKQDVQTLDEILKMLRQVDSSIEALISGYELMADEDPNQRSPNAEQNRYLTKAWRRFTPDINRIATSMSKLRRLMGTWE